MNNKIIYSRVAKTEAFNRGLERLRDGALKMHVAIMCAEKDPLACHRTILVARYGRKVFRGVQHILEDASIKTGEQADNRLLAEYHLDTDDFFSTREERIERAYALRADKIAYEPE